MQKCGTPFYLVFDTFSLLTVT